MPNARLYDSMLFNYETTYRTDFRFGDIIRDPKTTYQETHGRTQRKLPELKFVHTLTQWKDPHVPFELYVKPKEIIRTDPKNIQEQYTTAPSDIDKSEEVHKEVRTSRPRLVMTPALRIDDVANPGEHANLINDIYKSTVQAMQEQLYSNWRDTSYRSPLNGRLTVAVPIKMEKFKEIYVSPEWRMESASCDGRQIRGEADPTKMFWLQRVPNCSACKVSADVRTLKMAGNKRH